MDSIYSTIFGALLGEKNRGEVVGRDIIGDYTVDTCYTVDQGWETGVWKGSHEVLIVGRYPSREAAKEGHEAWCEVCQLEPSQAWDVQMEEILSF